MIDNNKYSISDNQENPDVILVRSMPLHDEKFGDNLKVVTRIGAGVNTIPIDKLTQMGVCVFNCPGGNANAVKEMTIAAMIMQMRNAFPAMQWLKSLPAEEAAAGGKVESGKETFRGPEILGKTIGIIGLGAIGGLMARSCFALGMKVIGFDPYLTHARTQELSQYCKFAASLDELLESSDIVTVHIPLNPETIIAIVVGPQPSSAHYKFPVCIIIISYTSNSIFCIWNCTSFTASRTLCFNSCT